MPFINISIKTSKILSLVPVLSLNVQKVLSENWVRNIVPELNTVTQDQLVAHIPNGVQSVLSIACITVTHIVHTEHILLASQNEKEY